MNLASLRRALAHPLVVLSAAAVTLAVLAWYAGPSLELGEDHPLAGPVARMGAVATAALAWAASAVAVTLRQNAATSKLLRALLNGEEDGPVVDARVAALRRKIDEALGLIGRGGGLPGRRRRARRLPWVLVAGPGRSGKSALLASAGLVLPFGPPPDWGGPKDDCSFVVGADAVFVDAAGRFAEAPEGSPDARVWLRLLDAVRRLRPRQPVCAIVLVLDAPGLAALPDDALRARAHGLRHLLDGTADRLGARPPVYLVAAKLDGVLGFADAFETLDRAERERPWGVPLLGREDEREPDPAGRFRAGFADLVRRASNRQLRRLDEEPDVGRRTLAFEFPGQLAALGAALEAVVEIVAAPHRFVPPPFLRGVFLLSAFEAGPPVDLIGRPAGARFGQEAGIVRLVEPAGGRGRSLFAAGLIRDLVVAETGGCGSSRGSRRSAAAARAAALAGLVALAAFVLVRWAEEFRATRAYAAETAAAAGGLGEELSAIRPAPALPPFAAVLPALRGFERLDGRPVPGGEEAARLAAEVRRAAAVGLDRLFLPYLDGRLRATLGDPSAPAALTLAALQLALALGGARPLRDLDLPAVGSTLTAAWFAGGPDAERRAFAAGIAALGSGPVTPRAPDSALVAAARRRLAAGGLAELALEIARASPEIAALPPWRPGDHAGAAAPAVLAVEGGDLWDGVPGAFTRAAFRGAVPKTLRDAAARVAEAAWALGDPGADDPEAVAEGAFRLYAADDVRAWDDLLSSLTVRPADAAGPAARALLVLTTSPSPASELLRAVAAETDLAPIPGETGPEAEAARAVTAAFAPLRRAASGPEGRPTTVEGALAALAPLYRALVRAARGGDAGEPGAPPGDAATAADAAAEADAAVAALPPQAQPLLRRMVAAALGTLDGAAGPRIRDAWAAVLPACLAATHDRYPFAPRAAADASPEDVRALLAPDGLLAAFRDRYLAPFIDTRGHPWRWRPGRPGALGLDAAALADFERADAVARALFPGGVGPQARFTLAVADLDPRAQAASLDLGGEGLRGARGAEAAGRWPAPRPDAPAALSLLPALPGEGDGPTAAGPWALFRLLDAAASRTDAGGSVLAGFAVGARRVAIRLTPSTVQDPFAPGLFERFRCPTL